MDRSAFSRCHSGRDVEDDSSVGAVRRMGSNGKAIYPPIPVVDCLLCDRTNRVFGASDGAGDGTDSLPWALFPQIVTSSTKTCKMSQDHKTEGS